jgi:hypothetical protein
MSTTPSTSTDIEYETFFYIKKNYGVRKPIFVIFVLIYVLIDSKYSIYLFVRPWVGTVSYLINKYSHVFKWVAQILFLKLFFGVYLVLCFFSNVSCTYPRVMGRT